MYCYLSNFFNEATKTLKHYRGQQRKEIFLWCMEGMHVLHCITPWNVIIDWMRGAIKQFFMCHVTAP